MKVLHILNELKPSGAEVMLQSAAHCFRKLGVSNDILATGLDEGVFAGNLRAVGYNVHHIPFRKRPSFFAEVYRLIKNHGYDAVHVHAERASFWLILLVLLAGVRPRNCIRTIHNCFPYVGFQRLIRMLQRKILVWLGVPYIAISKSVQTVEQKHSKIHTPCILNWYDDRRFVRTIPATYAAARLYLGLNPQDFVIVSVGNCSIVKNHSAIINAIANLNNRTIVYYHIGLEADASEKNLAKRLNVSRLIKFESVQDNIIPYLTAADLFVMPSLYEGFGIAAMEALATELPCLFSSTPGLIDFKTIFSGLYYCDCAVESVQATLEQILSLPRDHMRSATAGNAQIAKQKFGIERGVAEYVQLYRGGKSRGVEN